MVPELSVKNFSKSLEFYTKKLGFSVKYQRENPKFAYLYYQAVQIMLEEISPETWQTSELTFPLGRGINFQIEITDIDRLYQKLVEAGHSFFRDLKETSYQADALKMTQKEFLIQDPDGYLLRFCEIID